MVEMMFLLASVCVFAVSLLGMGLAYLHARKMVERATDRLGEVERNWDNLKVEEDKTRRFVCGLHEQIAGCRQILGLKGGESLTEKVKSLCSTVIAAAEALPYPDRQGELVAGIQGLVQQYDALNQRFGTSEENYEMECERSRGLERELRAAQSKITIASQPSRSSRRRTTSKSRKTK